MPKIAVLVRDFGHDKKAVVQSLRNTVEIGVAAIMHAIATGNPVIEKRIFDREDAEFPDRLLALADSLTRAHVNFSMYELSDDQVFSKFATYYEPDADALRCLIEERLRSLQEQRELGQLQDGVE